MLKKRALIMVSMDRSLFVKDSLARLRMIEYGSLIDELHLIVFSKRKHCLNKEELPNKVILYPTSSWSRAGYITEAISTGISIYKSLDAASYEVAVTTQDPFETGLVGKRLKKKCNIPLQVQIHTDFLSPYFKRGNILNHVRVPIAKDVLKSADQVRVVSKRIADSLRALVDEKKITILPIHALQKDSSQNPTRKKFGNAKQIILMASRLSREKNFRAALEAFRNVSRGISDVGLVIVGSGPERSNLEHLVRKFGLSKRVFFEGWQEDVSSYYKSADAFLLSSWYEGYGLVLIEAAQAGLPIVTTDVGIAGELLKDGEGAFICLVNDSDCLSEKLLTLLRDKELRSKFSEELAHMIDKDVPLAKEYYLKKHGELFGLLFNVTMGKKTKLSIR